MEDYDAVSRSGNAGHVLVARAFKKECVSVMRCCSAYLHADEVVSPLRPLRSPHIPARSITAQRGRDIIRVAGPSWIRLLDAFDRRIGPET